MGCFDRISPVSRSEAVIQAAPKVAATIAITVSIVALLVILANSINSAVYKNLTFFKPTTVDIVWEIAKWAGVSIFGCVALSFVITSCYSWKQSKEKNREEALAYFRMETLRSFCFPFTICS